MLAYSLPGETWLLPEKTVGTTRCFLFRYDDKANTIALTNLQSSDAISARISWACEQDMRKRRT